jgi:hypothetical protein
MPYGTLSPVTAHRCKVVKLGWEFSLVTYPGFTPVGNATLVVTNVLTCNKHSHSGGGGSGVDVPPCPNRRQATPLPICHCKGRQQPVHWLLIAAAYSL